MMTVTVCCFVMADRKINHEALLTLEQPLLKVPAI
jgi:hypothetical protein